MKATIWCTGPVPFDIKKATHCLLVEQAEGDGCVERTYFSKYKLVILWHLTKEYLKYLKNLYGEMQQN